MQKLIEELFSPISAEETEVRKKATREELLASAAAMKDACVSPQPLINQQETVHKFENAILDAEDFNMFSVKDVEVIERFFNNTPSRQNWMRLARYIQVKFDSAVD